VRVTLNGDKIYDEAQKLEIDALHAKIGDKYSAPLEFMMN
jgi:hypothetical protein